MALNKPLSPPPIGSAVIDNNKMCTTPWISWTNDLFRKVNGNIQTTKGAQPLNLDSNNVDIQSGASSFSITLDAPTINGVPKIIGMSVYGGGNVTLDLTNVLDSSGPVTTATWNGVNQVLFLISYNSKWFITKNFNVSIT